MSLKHIVAPVRLAFGVSNSKTPREENKLLSPSNRYPFRVGLKAFAIPRKYACDSSLLGHTHPFPTSSSLNDCTHSSAISPGLDSYHGPWHSPPGCRKRKSSEPAVP